MSEDAARRLAPRVPLFLDDQGTSGGVGRLVARFVYERPGKAPAARGRRADTRVHSGLRREAL